MERVPKCIFEPYLALLFIFSVLIAAAYMISINHSTNQIQKTCHRSPNITITDDIDSLISMITNTIKQSRRVIQLSFSDLNYTLFNVSILPSIQIAHDNGAEITLFADSSAILTSLLKKHDYIQFFDISKYEEQLSTQSIVADQTAFIAPFLGFHTDALIRPQLLTFSECDAIVDDIFSFVDYYRYSYQNNKQTSISGRYIAQTSAIKPLTFNHSNFFMFHSPKSFINPLRIDASQIINSLLDECPLELRLFTNSPVCMSSFIDAVTNDFSFYYSFKSLLLRNSTKVNFLVSNASFEHSKICCESLAAFENLELRFFNQKYQGPNFMIASLEDSSESFIFSRPINEIEHNIISLHFATNDENIYQYLAMYYDEIWNQSHQIHVKWPL